MGDEEQTLESGDIGRKKRDRKGDKGTDDRGKNMVQYQ
jgi:hypothetical protein